MPPAAQTHPAPAPVPRTCPEPSRDPGGPVTSIPVAAAEPLRDLLVAPAREAVVVGAFPTAAYVAVGGEVIAVETTDALRLPCAVVIPRTGTRRPLHGLRPGCPARVGDGGLTAGPLAVRVGRWWQPRRARAWHDAPLDAVSGSGFGERAAGAAAVLPVLPAALDGPLARLEDRLAAHDLAGLEAAVGDLLGLGPGLTPAGDDVLAGFLVAAHAGSAASEDADPAGDPIVDAVVRAVVGTAPLLTTTLSATLLRHAAHGRGIPALLDLVDALGGRPRHGDVGAAVARLASVGSTSGAALGHGVLAAARLFTSRRVLTAAGGGPTGSR